MRFEFLRRQPCLATTQPETIEYSAFWKAEILRVGSVLRSYTDSAGGVHYASGTALAKTNSSRYGSDCSHAARSRSSKLEMFTRYCSPLTDFARKYSLEKINAPVCDTAQKRVVRVFRIEIVYPFSERVPARPKEEKKWV